MAAAGGVGWAGVVRVVVGLNVLSDEGSGADEGLLGRAVGFWQGEVDRVFPGVAVVVGYVIDPVPGSEGAMGWRGIRMRGCGMRW